MVDLQNRIAALISIHAPAWGATLKKTLEQLKIEFQSTRPRGARRRSRRKMQKPCNFNPRARVGRDRLKDTQDYLDAISIHAPAWGATGHGTSLSMAEMISIHAPRVGRDAWASFWRGVVLDFNPRARVGRDAPKFPAPCRRG